MSPSGCKGGQDGDVHSCLCARKTHNKRTREMTKRVCAKGRFLVPKLSAKGVSMVDTREESVRKREEPLANVLSTPLGW